MRINMRHNLLLWAVVVLFSARFENPAALAESKQVFGIHSWDWGANVDVMSNRTGWCVEANVTANDSADVNRHKWASGEGFTLMQRLDWKWEQTIPLTGPEQDQFAIQCRNWANAIKRYTRHYSIGNEVEFFDVTPSIYAACFQKVRAAIKSVQPDAIVAIGHMNNSNNQYQTMLLLGPDGFDGVTAHTGSSVPTNLFDYLDQANARPEVGVYITEWGWVAGTNPGTMGVMAGFAQAIGQWNATHSRQVFCACWYLYPDFLGITFSLETSPIDNAAFENATTLGLALNSLQNSPVVMSDLTADVLDMGTAVSLSWTTNLSSHMQLWWTEDGTWSWDHEKFTDRTATTSTSHQYTITGLAPSTTYEVMPNCTKKDHADAGGRRFHLTTGPWSSTAEQIPSSTPTMRISWHTSWASDSRVQYGPSPAPAFEVIDSAIATNHVVTLSGLSPGTYYYRVASAEPEADPQVGRLLVRSAVRTFVVKPQSAGDYDVDGDVDGDDAQAFAACFSGPADIGGYILPSQACQDAFDADQDTDVDCEDYVGFLMVWTGPPVCPPAFTICQTDCDSDGVQDACQIAQGLADDCDDNGVPDHCQPDADGDSVPDACDLCPGTPPGSLVDREGCPTFLKSDLDRDGDVDQDDFGLLQICYSGSGIAVTDAACLTARLDDDDDVDRDDCEVFMGCFAGPNVPIDPTCEQ